MRDAKAAHDELARTIVEAHGGIVATVADDAMHAAFPDPREAIDAVLELQQRLAAPAVTEGLKLEVRCAVHLGDAVRRGNDWFGQAVEERAAR